jgi:hypothetical protein
MNCIYKISTYEFGDNKEKNFIKISEKLNKLWVYEILNRVVS